MNQPNQNQPNFTPVTGGGTYFKPQSTEENGFAYNPQDYARNVLEGYLKGSREVSTQYGPGTVWDIHQYNAATGELGEVLSIFQDTFLAGCLQKIKINSFVHVEYKGRVRKKNVPAHHPIAKTNSYHSWMVGVADNMPPYAEMLKRAGLPVSGMAAGTPPVQNQGFNPPAQGFTPPPPAPPQAPPTQQQPPQHFSPPPQYGQPGPASTGQAPPQYQPPAPTAAPTPPAAPAWTPPPPMPPAAPTQPGTGQWSPPPPQAPQAPQQPVYNQPPAAPAQGNGFGGAQNNWNPDQAPPF